MRDADRLRRMAKMYERLAEQNDKAGKPTVAEKMRQAAKRSWDAHDAARRT